MVKGVRTLDGPHPFVEIVSFYRQLSVTGENINRNEKPVEEKCDRVTDWQSDKSDLTIQLHATISTCCTLKFLSNISTK